MHLCIIEIYMCLTWHLFVNIHDCFVVWTASCGRYDEFVFYGYMFFCEVRIFNIFVCENLQMSFSGNISSLFLQLSVVGLEKTTVLPVVDEDDEPDYDMTDEFKTSKLAESSTTEKVIEPVSVNIPSALYFMHIWKKVFLFHFRLQRNWLRPLRRHHPLQPARQLRNSLNRSPQTMHLQFVIDFQNRLSPLENHLVS